MNKKSGFTLVELLAVIVLLAIILAIAIPGISSLINNATKNSFADDAKMVIKAINYKLMNDSSFDVTTIDETNANSILGISASNYSDLIVTKNNDDIRVVITGQAKWAGLVTYGTYTDMKVDDMPTGLVGYWNLDGNANDSSGNGNNGTVYGATLTTDNKGRANSAYSFDGTDDYIGIPYSSTLAPTAQISFGIWVYKADWSTPFGKTSVPLSKAESGGYSCNFDCSGGSNYLACTTYRNGIYGVTAQLYTSFTPGWHNITSVYDGRYLKLYIDGILKSTDDSGANYNITYSVNNSMIIGGEASTSTTPASGFYYAGKIDNIRIYNKALTEAEINVIYNIEK